MPCKTAETTATTLEVFFLLFYYLFFLEGWCILVHLLARLSATEVLIWCYYPHAFVLWIGSEITPRKLLCVVHKLTWKSSLQSPCCFYYPVILARMFPRNMLNLSHESSDSIKLICLSASSGVSAVEWKLRWRRHSLKTRNIRFPVNVCVFLSFSLMEAKKAASCAWLHTGYSRLVEST